MDDMDIDNVIEVPDTPDRVAVQNINRRDCIIRGNYSSISSRLGISGFSDEELKIQPWKNKYKVTTERGSLRTSVRPRSSLYISDDVEINEKSRIPALEKEVPRKNLRLPRKPVDNTVIYEGKPYAHPQLIEKGKALSSTHSLMSSSKGHGAVLDSSKQNGNSKACTKIIWKNSRSEECREGRLVDNIPSSHFVENSSAVDSNSCKVKEKLVDTEDIGSRLDRGKGIELGAESQTYLGRPVRHSFHLSNSHRTNSQKRLVRNGCISPHNVEKAKLSVQKHISSFEKPDGEMAKQSVQKHISSFENPEQMDTEIRELIAESGDSCKVKGKGLLTRDFVSKQSDAKTVSLFSRNLTRSGKDDGINDANQDAFECSEGLGRWISTHNRTRKLNPQISDADVIVSSRKDDKLNELNINVSGSPIVQSASRFKHQVGRLDEHRHAANTIIKRHKQDPTGNHQGESSSSAFNNCEVVALGSPGEPSNIRSASTPTTRNACSSKPVIEIDEFSPEIRNGGPHKVDGKSNVDSGVRARQLEADEILARELQEQLYNELPAIGVCEMDEHIALALQQEGSSHPTSSGSHRLPPPQLMRDLVRQTRSQSSQNPPILRATRARVPTSTRMPRFRGRFPGQPRTISSNQRDSLFHPDVDVDMRIQLLEALEAFSDMGMAGDLLTQRDFNENDYEMLLALDENNHQHGGASAAQINGLPQSTVQSDNLEDCSICLEAPSSGDTIRHLPCLHRFHKDCIDQWLSRKSSCPVCKSSIT